MTTSFSKTMHLNANWKNVLAGLVCVQLLVGASSASAVLIDLTGANAVSSSDENAGRAAEFAFDDNPGTRWASSFTDTEWLYVDLGATYELEEVGIDWEGAVSRDYTFRAFLGAVPPDPDSNVGDWTTIATVTGHSDFSGTSGGAGGPIDDSFDFVNGTYTENAGATVDSSSVSTSPQARYLLFHATDRATNFGHSIRELDVIASAVPEPSSFLLVGVVGLGTLGVARRRRVR